MEQFHEHEKKLVPFEEHSANLTLNMIVEILNTISPWNYETLNFSQALNKEIHKWMEHMKMK